MDQPIPSTVIIDSEAVRPLAIRHVCSTFAITIEAHTGSVTEVAFWRGVQLSFTEVGDLLDSLERLTSFHWQIVTHKPDRTRGQDQLVVRPLAQAEAGAAGFARDHSAQLLEDREDAEAPSHQDALNVLYSMRQTSHPQLERHVRAWARTRGIAYPPAA